MDAGKAKSRLATLSIQAADESQTKTDKSVFERGIALHSSFDIRLDWAKFESCRQLSAQSTSKNVATSLAAFERWYSHCTQQSILVAMSLMQRNRESDERYDPNDSRIAGNSDTRDEATELKDAKETFADLYGYNKNPHRNTLRDIETEHKVLLGAMQLMGRQDVLDQSRRFISSINTGISYANLRGDKPFQEELENLIGNASTLGSKLLTEPRLFQSGGGRVEGDTDPWRTEDATIVAQYATDRHNRLFPDGYERTFPDGPDGTPEEIGEVMEMI
nr:hypothetical protein L203_06635 [Cryptococcus depauperatus CBS 7841]